MVMDVIWRLLCVSMICSELGKGATSDAGKYLLRTANANVVEVCAGVVAFCG